MAGFTFIHISIYLWHKTDLLLPATSWQEINFWGKDNFFAFHILAQPCPVLSTGERCTAAKSSRPACHGPALTATTTSKLSQKNAAVRQQLCGNIRIDKRPAAYLMAEPMTSSLCLDQGSGQALPPVQVTPFKREQPESSKIALVPFRQIVLAVDELWLSEL